MNYLNRPFQWMLSVSRNLRGIQALEDKVERLTQEQILSRIARANLRRSFREHLLELQEHLDSLETDITLYNPAIAQLKEQLDELENTVIKLCEHQTASHQVQLEALKDVLAKLEAELVEL